MSDLFNNFPSWGEVGEYPQDGFFYDGGDQVNEKHMDALWNGIQSHFDNLNTAIRDRVRDLDGNVVLDQGLVASEGSGTREVDVTASSDGAYVDGQRTGSVSADTLTHTTNGTGSTRTDVVWVNTDGSVGKTEDTATTSSTQLKIAEVDVATDDTISAVRNYARDHAHHVASENAPSNPEPGDLWHDLTNNLFKVRRGGSWEKSLTGADSATVTAGDGLKGGGTLNLDGGSVTINIEPADFAGDGLSDDSADNLQVDQGSGSGLDADTVDGSHASEFATGLSVGSYTTRSTSDGQFSNPENSPIFVVVSLGGGASVDVDGTTIYEQTNTSSDQEKGDISFLVPENSNYTLNSGIDGSFSSHSYTTIDIS